MGRDTIQLEDTVSTISHEYLLEFTSEYGIPESLHPELPGLEEPIVEFLEGKVNVYTKFFEFANYHIDLFSLISAPNPTKMKIDTRPRVAHEVPLLMATASRVIDMKDTTVASGSSGTPSALENLEKEVAAMGPPVNKRHLKRSKGEAEANAPPKVLRKDHAAFRPAQSTLGGESLASMRLDAGFIISTHATLDAPTVVSDPDSLSYAKPQPHYSEDIQCAGSYHDHYQEAACAHHEEHVMHDCVQLDQVVDSHDDYTSDSNIILYDQYVKDNEVPVIHSDLSYVPDDAFMMIYDDMCEPLAPYVSNTSRNAAVKTSLTAELATYREQVE
nr:hypothetical protein [Tanacetum cinerariifolium]